MDDYKLLGKDEVREIMGGCSGQMAYRVIREPNSELREKGIATVQGKVSKKYLLERYFGETVERGAEQCR